MADPTITLKASEALLAQLIAGSQAIRKSRAQGSKLTHELDELVVRVSVARRGAVNASVKRPKPAPQAPAPTDG